MLRRLLAGVWKVIELVWFVVMFIPAIPLWVLQFAVGRVQDGIERRWPESDRARAVSWWIGCLVPLLVPLAALVVMSLLLLWVLEQRRLRGID